jgi:hypothetical protein
MLMYFSFLRTLHLNADAVYTILSDKIQWIRAVYLQSSVHIAAIRSNVFTKVYRRGSNASSIVTITV